MLSVIDWVVLITYFIFVIGMGLKIGKKNETQEDYFVGGREFKWWAIGLSIIATQVSAVTYIGAPGWAYRDGMVAIIMTLNIPIVMWIVSSYFAPFFYNCNVMSVYEYLEKRFGHKIRLIMAIAFIIKILFVVGTIVYAPSLVLSKITGLDINITIAIITVIAVFYTIMGGIKAVIWTDVIQMVVLWLGLIICFVIVIQNLPNGFLGAINYASELGKLKALNFTPGFKVPNSVWAGIFGGGVLHLAYFGVDQSQVQRYLTAKSMKNVKLSLKFSSIVVVIQMFIFMLMGILLLSYYKGKVFENPNDVFLLFIIKHAPIGILGLIIAAIFAGAMSSIDSALNSLSTVFVRDVVDRWSRKKYNDKELLKISKISTFVWGVLVAAFAFLVSNSNLPILEAISKYSSYLLGSMLGVFALGFFFDKANEKGTIAGFISGILMVAYIANVYKVYWMWNNLIGLSICLIVGIIVSYSTGGEVKEVHPYTLKGQKKYFEENNLEIREDGVYIIPGKVEKSTYVLLGFFVVVMILLAFLN